MLTGVSTSNGLDWSPDGRTMYYTDTRTGRVDVFDFDARRGTISRRRLFVSIPEEIGYPDGLVVDESGFVWLALWEGGALHRMNPDGLVERIIPMPVTLPTKCAFAGKNLEDLYITTAWIGLDETEKARQQHAGGLYRVRPGVRGRPAHRFAG
jgi:sugar lactone lactonase YvrE